MFESYEWWENWELKDLSKKVGVLYFIYSKYKPLIWKKETYNFFKRKSVSFLQPPAN